MRVFERILERVVELLKRLPPILVFGFDLVEVRFHLAGVAEAEDRRKRVDEHVGDDLAHIGCTQPFVTRGDGLDVLAVLNRADDRGVGRRPTNALFFELLLQRRFIETRRRAGEMLGRREVQGAYGLLLFERREDNTIRSRHAGDFKEAIKDKRSAGRAEGRIDPVGIDLDRRRIPLGQDHLAGDKPTPDQIVELVLLVVELVAYRTGRDRDVRWPDRFVGFLRILIRRLVEVRLLGQVLLATGRFNV